jgi:hypothetical protein
MKDKQLSDQDLAMIQQLRVWHLRSHSVSGHVRHIFKKILAGGEFTVGELAAAREEYNHLKPKTGS